MSSEIICLTFICVACISLAYGREPGCSKYDYEEKLLSKVIRMEIRLEQLESRSSKFLRVESRMDRLTSQLADLTSKQNSKPKFSESKTASGGTYTRWGRTVCAGSDVQLVYKGYAGGSNMQHKGAAANYLCLPEDPEWANYDDAEHKTGVFVYGAEYQTSDGSKEVFKGQKIESTYVEDAPCVVCLSVRPTILMIPAKVTFPLVGAPSTLVTLWQAIMDTRRRVNTSAWTPHQKLSMEAMLTAMGSFYTWLRHVVRR